MGLQAGAGVSFQVNGLQDVGQNNVVKYYILQLSFLNFYLLVLVVAALLHAFVM